MESVDRSCPNCREPIAGRFCPVCGQDVHRRLETVLSFLRRVAAEAGDLEGPFWRTFWLILRRPGALTREYSERRFRSQVAPVRLYLAVAAAWFLFYPIWNSWIPLGGMSFASPAVFALTVPTWAACVHVGLVGRQRVYEESFVFSAHFHVAYLVLLACVGIMVALWGALGLPPEPGMWTLFVFLVAFPPAYVLTALRNAFGLGWLRASISALVLGVGHVFVMGFVGSVVAGELFA